MLHELKASMAPAAFGGVLGFGGGFWWEGINTETSKACDAYFLANPVTISELVLAFFHSQPKVQNLLNVCDQIDFSLVSNLLTSGLVGALIGGSLAVGATGFLRSISNRR